MTTQAPTQSLVLLGCASRAQVLVKLLRAVGPLCWREAERDTGWPHEDFVQAVKAARGAGQLTSRNTGGQVVLAAVAGGATCAV